ncbi:Prp 4 [Fusarium oxysporum]|uniref:Prp 4 CRoW domain-containing protein n=1 Tax=Fusarium oxysporum TaxID=5507 RepID=A0A420M9I1_FUSOX|nr:Prp 4 [Fusarium oxysporum]RKK62451.1 hypothetical protein BFJ69_g17023 [Fusarium oxysporum]
MQLLATLFFVGTTSAHIPLVAGRSSAFLALKGIMERQVDSCEPVPAPYTCERSCGPGFVECINFPTCYNPGRGDICCSDGSSCPAGYYCTDAICCPDEMSIEECGATATLSVIPPPAKKEPSTSANPLKPTATDKATSEAEPTTSEAGPTTSEAEPTASEAEPTTLEAEPITSTDALSVITTNAISTTTPASNSIIATTSLPPHVTVAGAERNAQFRVLAAIGGLGAILMVV